MIFKKQTETADVIVPYYDIWRALVKVNLIWKVQKKIRMKKRKISRMLKIDLTKH